MKKNQKIFVTIQLLILVSVIIGSIVLSTDQRITIFPYVTFLLGANLAWIIGLTGKRK